MDLGDYVEVKHRLRDALAQHPDLRVVEHQPELITAADKQFLLCTVTVYRSGDDLLPNVASAWEPLPGRTPYTRDSELMVGMTSALGRALGYMGYGIAKSLASRNEVENRPPESPRIDAKPVSATSTHFNPDNAATEKQKRAIFVISKKHGVPMPDVDAMTVADAGQWIETMDKRP